MAQTLDIAERIVRLSGDDIWTNYTRLKAAIHDSVLKRYVPAVGTDFSCQAGIVDDSWSFLEALIPPDSGMSRSSRSMKKYIIDELSSSKAKDTELAQLRRSVARLENDSQQRRSDHSGDRARLTAAEDKAKQLEQDVASLTAEAQTARRETATAEKRLNAAEQTLKDVNQLLATKELAISEAQKAESDALARLATLQDKLTVLRGTRTDELAAAQESGRATLAGQIEKDRAARAAQLAEVRQELGRVEARHAQELQAAEEKAVEAAAEGEARVAELQDRLAQQQVRISRLRAALGADEEVNASASAKLRMLEQPTPSPALPPQPITDAKGRVVVKKRGRAR